MVTESRSECLSKQRLTDSPYGVKCVFVGCLLPALLWSVL